MRAPKGEKRAGIVEEKRRIASHVLSAELRDRAPDSEEQSLIQRLKAGDHDAFEAIFSRYVTRVYRQAFKLMGNEAEAEEVVQEVFLTIYQKAKTFRGESAFSTWLHRLTVNVGLTRLRRRKRGKEVCLDDYLPQFQEDGHHKVRPVVDWSQDIEGLVAGKELQTFIQQAIDQLPPVDKAVVVQSDLEGISNREISQYLGLSVPAVKARLHRARLFLRGKLEAHVVHCRLERPYAHQRADSNSPRRVRYQ